jgi:hypothetical protein
MKVCPKCERNIFDNEEFCSTCGATVEVAAQAPAENQRSYGMFTGSCMVYLILCLSAALGCFLMFLAGIHRNSDEMSSILLVTTFITPISGFILYGFSKLAGDAANDIRITAEKASAQAEKAFDQTRLLASIANDLSTQE